MAKAKGMFRGQYEGEEVLFVFRKHPVVMRKGLILFMIALLLGTLPTYVVSDPTFGLLLAGLGVGFVVGVILMFPSWIYWYFSVYIVTDQRFIQVTQKGFFNKKVIDLALNQIQMVNYEVSGIQETVLGFGTITVQTFVGNLVIHNVHRPARVQHELLGLLRARGIATTASASSPQDQGNEEDTEDED